MVEIPAYKIDMPHCEKYPPSACRLVIFVVLSAAWLFIAAMIRKENTTYPFLFAFSICSVKPIGQSPDVRRAPSAPPLSIRNSREVLLTHRSVTSIPIQTLYTHRCSLLARVKPFALTLAVGGCGHGGTWSATFPKIDLFTELLSPFELLLGLFVPRLFHFVNWGRHLVFDYVAFMSGCVGTNKCKPSGDDADQIHDV